MPDELRLIAADAVVTMDAALPKVLPTAGVVVRGERIAAVGELADLRRQFGELPLERLRARGVLLPGFINAHTHLELSYQSAAGLKADAFPQWVSRLIAGYPTAEQLEKVVRASIRKGAAESLAAGVTTLGDISRQASMTRDELAGLLRLSRTSVPRVVSFGEVVGLGKMRERTAALLDAAAKLPDMDADLRSHLMAGISPHAPYTVEGPALRSCVRRAIIKRLPMAMHLAELAEEAQFLRNLSGPLGREWDLMQKMDILDERIPLLKGGPVRWAQLWGLLIADARENRPRSFPVLLVHVNCCDNAEMAQLAASQASVAYCPRTHAYFAHPPHRYRDMLASGINVCLGTDSLASNPDLSVLREAQLLWQRDHTEAFTLLEMLTRRGAAALGLGDQLGTLAPGKLADMILLPMDEPDVIERIVAEAPTPAAVWIGGERVGKSPA